MPSLNKILDRVFPPIVELTYSCLGYGGSLSSIYFPSSSWCYILLINFCLL